MVSLSRDINSSTTGGIFFSDSSVNSTESDTQALLQPVVGKSNLKTFFPLRTIPAAGFLLLLAVIIQVVVIVFVIIQPKGEKKCEPYFLLLYSHTVYWAFSFIIHQHFKKQHHESKIRGYIEFHQKTQSHCAIPFYVTSCWNALLLAVGTLFHEQYGDLKSRCQSHGFLTPINYMCFIITIENVIMVPTIISYIMKVSRFNYSKHCPDAQRDEWMSSFIQDSYSSGEVGYREKDNQIEDLLEKQADLIRYLKEQNSRLNQKVMILTCQLQEKQDSQIT